MKVFNSTHHMEKFNEVLELVEKECVIGGVKDFVGMLYQHFFWNAKYLQKIFGYVADISLKDYIRRRRLTEAFYMIEDFEHLKITAEVGGISNAKRKIIREFGENPVNLQRYLYDEIDEKKLKERLEWKLENGLHKREEISTDKLVLYSENPDRKRYDLENTYFVCGKKYFGIRGNYVGKTTEKDYWLSNLFQKDVYITTSCYEAATKIAEELYQVLRGAKMSSEKSMNLCMDVYFDGGFEFRRLVEEVKTRGDCIFSVKVNKLIKMEEKELIFDIKQWLTES